MLVLALVVVPLLFPDGRLLSGRWLVVLVTTVASAAGQAVGTIVKPGLLDSVPFAIENPTGIPALEGLAQLLLDVSGVVLLPCLLLAALAAALRFRHGTPIERQQLKWFGSAMGLAALGLVGAATLPQPIGIACYVVTTIALGFVPVAIGMPILRYRLYDIDRLIGRTLAYTAVTALLATAFVGTNLSLQGLLADVTGGETSDDRIRTLRGGGSVPATATPGSGTDRPSLQPGPRGRATRAAARPSGPRPGRSRGASRGRAGAVHEAVAPSRAGIWLRPNS